MSFFAADRRIAAAQRRTLMASMVCFVWTCVVMLAWKLGKVAPTSVFYLGLFNVAGVTLFNVAIRSGWSLRFADVGMTQAQLVFAIVSMCGAYALVPMVHAAVIQTMCLALVFGTFSLSDRQCIRSGYLLALIPLVTVCLWSLLSPDSFEMARDGVPAIGASIIFLIMSRLLSQFCRLRHALNEQRNELRTVASEIEHLAMTDELTGLINRRCVAERAAALMARQARSDTPLCLALLDLDHFKQVNDTFGHHVGDEVLQGLALTLKSELRQTDVAARWGGEEFLVLLPEADLEAALAILGRVLSHLRTRAIAASNPTLRATFSAGLVQWNRVDSFEVLVRQADQAMYRAKEQGRARVSVADQVIE